MGKVIFSALLTILLTAAPAGGILFAFIIGPIVFVWLIVNFLEMYRKPDQRKAIAPKVAIWLFVIALVASLQTYYHFSARSDAMKVVSLVVEFKNRTGSYPESEKDMGLREGENGVFYGLKDGKPVLFYFSTLLLYASYQYNFEAGAWEFIPD